MARRTLPLCVLLALALSACDAAAAQEHVALHATHPDGVPIHPAEGSREMSGRLPDGARVEVLAWGAGRRWLEVRAPGGRRGWISARYLTRPAPVDPDSALAPAWRSAASCAATPPPARADGPARIASWNLRWFPDGSSHGPSDHPTDLAWMACAMASLSADAIAVQEVMLHARGRAAIEELTRRLSERTGGRWRSRFDHCPRDGRQHVGWLLDASRVVLADVRELDDVNPLGACSGRLRPGLAASARFAGGRRLTLVTVHLDSGTDARDHAHRVQSVERLAASLGGRADAVVVGDFNAMGTRSLTADRELVALDAHLASGALRRVISRTPCTEFYRRRGGTLDLALVTAPLLEGSTVEVAGPCASLRCALPRGAHPESLTWLSDHCPIVLELAVR